MNSKLTDEQKKLIEDNLPFMYWWFEKHHVYDEDTIQDLLYNFCALIHLYDPKRGAITTFIDTLNRSKICKLWKKDFRKQTIEKFMVGLTDSYDPSHTWQEVIGDVDCNLVKYEEENFADYLFSRIKTSGKVKKKDLNILNTYLDTGNMAAAGRLLGVTRQQVSKTIIKIRKEIINSGWLYD